MTTTRRLLVLALLLLVPLAAAAPLPPEDDARQLALLLRSLDRGHRVLYVTAHPDDEDAAVLARLRFGDGAETALLTLTRGQGGQNELGTELFDALGVLRVREMEAAGRWTGVRQFYSRAYDFGYSFSVEETFAEWGDEEILQDLVRVIRLVRPDVILTLPPGGDGGGQHHQASARLAQNAFRLAATDRWPGLGRPHRALRLFRVVWGEEAADPARAVEVETGLFDPILGGTYEEFGDASRSQHKCQGMARVTGPLPGRVSHWEWVASADSDDPPRPATRFLEDLVPGDLRTAAWRDIEAEYLDALADCRDAYDPEDPGSLVVPLERLLAVARRGAPSRFRERIEAALALASGLRVEARARDRFAAPGDTLIVVLAARNLGPFPVTHRSRVLAVGHDLATATRDLLPGESVQETLSVVVPATFESTAQRPLPRHAGDTPTTLFWSPLDPNTSTFALLVTATVHDTRFTFRKRVEEVTVDESFPAVVHADPRVVPDPSLRATGAVVPWVLDGGEAAVPVTFLVGSLAGGTVTVTPTLPAGWSAEPANREVHTRAGGAEEPVRFLLRPGEAVRHAAEEADTPARVTVTATARLGNRVSHQGVRRIEYPHIRPDVLLEEARVDLSPVVVRVPRGLRVGYVAGPGDRTGEALVALGVEPVFLGRDQLLEEDLSPFDVIVIGVRAYKTREDLKTAQPRLQAWMEAGGALVVQYQKFEFNAGDGPSPFAPYPARVGSRRVTDETAPITVEDPSHPLFREPNALGAADWAGWVQERGLYFLDAEDPAYENLVVTADPFPYNPGEQEGALVTARVGKGSWTYVGLGLFRQLPAGVPGTYRLLANLLALGAPAD